MTLENVWSEIHITHHDAHAGFLVVSMVCLCKAQARANDSVGGLECLSFSMEIYGMLMEFPHLSKSHSIRSWKPAPTSLRWSFLQMFQQNTLLAGGFLRSSPQLCTKHLSKMCVASFQIIKHLKERGRLQADDSIGQTNPAVVWHGCHRGHGLIGKNHDPHFTWGSIGTVAKKFGICSMMPTLLLMNRGGVTTKSKMK